MKALVLNLVIVGMTLGTAWAVRGQFGHEQGAAWAASIGAICVILIADKQEWYNRVFKIVLAAAIGWGIGGMISYGLVVGYGRGIDFINVYYGLAMLFVIGGLYGILGGGLFGLALTNPGQSKIDWPRLITEMVAGAVVAYFFLIMQWEWLMTPPRDEMWAACFGMAVALAWYLIRNKHHSALRVALFSGLGAGFGFAFGNFLQVMGNTTGIAFNFWNVMEYSIGFFGGIGMAYGTFTSQWDFSENEPQRSGSLVPMLILVLFIPFVVWEQSFGTERLTNIYQQIISGNLSVVVTIVRTGVLLLVLGYATAVTGRFYGRTGIKARQVKNWFLAHFGVYILFSLLITGAIFSSYRVEQYLYLVNYAVVLFFLSRREAAFQVKLLPGNKIWYAVSAVVVLLALLALIAINSHGEMGGMQERF